jgi:regulator of sigma D
MNENSEQIQRYLEYLTGNIIHTIDSINNINISDNEYNELSKEVNMIGESLDNIYKILQQKGLMKPIDYQTAHQLTQERKINIIRDNKINTILL